MRLRWILDREEKVSRRWRTLFYWPAYVVLTCAFIALAGCETVREPVTDTFCLIAKPIHGDRKNDTAETMRQIDEHNLVGVRLCNW